MLPLELVGALVIVDLVRCDGYTTSAIALECSDLCLNLRDARERATRRGSRRLVWHGLDDSTSELMSAAQL